MIEVKNLVKRYGDKTAIDHLDLSINDGEIYGLLGPNGSGKTTLINCMLSLLEYEKGSIQISGQTMKSNSFDLKEKIGIVPQQIAVFEEFTVEENIRYFCNLYIKDVSKTKKLTDAAISFCGLEEHRKFIPKKLSGGLARRLNLACGIAHQPKLIFMDEPTVAVDVQSRNNILEGIRKLNENGATVIYTTHYMEEVEQICTRVAIMDKGKVIAEGTNEELKNMIHSGDKLTVELLNFNAQDIKKLSGESWLTEYELNGRQLVVNSKKGENSVYDLLAFFNRYHITYDSLYSSKPTLNTVFLELTGKTLRD